MTTEVKQSRSLYSVPLHMFFEIVNTDQALYARAIRVPGGWIYQFWDLVSQEYIIDSGVFVPFNNEFQTPNQ